jgi:hypothetical protein
MMTRRFVTRILLLALLLAPSGLRAFSSDLAASSCRLQNPIRARATGKSALRLPNRLVVSTKTHRDQMQRMHRIRGKRLNAETPILSASVLNVVGPLQCLKLSAPARESTSPNPSRGPPSLLI